MEQGQLLFELYSPTLVNAQEEFLAALSSKNSVLRDASRDRRIALGVTSGEVQQLERERKARQRVRVFAENDGVIAHLMEYAKPDLKQALAGVKRIDADRYDWSLNE